MNISVKNIKDIKNTLLFTTIAICFLLISMDALSRGFQKILDDNIDAGYTRFLYIVLVLLFVTSLLKRTHKKAKSIDITLFIFSMYFLLIYGTDMLFSVRNIIFSLFTILWMLSFKFGQGFAYWNYQKLNIAFFYFGLLVIIPLSLQTFVLYIQSDILSFREGGNDALFAIIAYLPFVFVIKERKLFKIILISILLIIALISLKRSIILAAFLSTIVYTLLIVDKKKIIKYVFSVYTLVILAVVIYAYRFLEKLVLETILGRFEKLSEDGGSGRDGIYSTLLDVYLNSDATQFWLGHGYKATLIYEGRLAHNDFLNILFDFGIIGFSLYMSFILLLLYTSIKKFRAATYYRNEYATFIATLIIFFVLSSVNNLIYSPNLLMPITFIMGLTYTQLQFKKYKEF